MAASVVPETDSIRRAVLLLNAVDPGRFPRLLSRLLQRLHLKAETSFSEEEEEKLQIAFSLEKQDLHLVLEAISFILEQAVYHNLKPASLQQQLQSIHLDQDKAEAFASAWAAAGQETIEKFRQRVLTPQKLETIGWQLNLEMSATTQAKLKSPRAVLELGVSNEDSKISQRKVAEVRALTTKSQLGAIHQDNTVLGAANKHTVKIYTGYASISAPLMTHDCASEA
ncbi:COMM domain-containing protein 10 isoform X1 [Numida meleagris]|uniref:COMM domain-containing protein 10 isoform X1 n=1 Tax=Numida meleagris TaxID=8996 RepID=UPI000B3DDA88|nr:COMM domain-containing protein 10 isoform X1 [Numida meleagris]